MAKSTALGSWLGGGFGKSARLTHGGFVINGTIPPNLVNLKYYLNRIILNVCLFQFSLHHERSEGMEPILVWSHC